MNDVTLLLSAIEQGDNTAAEQLLPLVYDEPSQAGDSGAETGKEKALARRWKKRLWFH